MDDTVHYGGGGQPMTSGPAMCGCKSAGMLQGLQLHPMTRPLTWTGKGQNQQFWIIRNRYVAQWWETIRGEHHSVVLLCFTHYSFINGSNLYVNKGCYSHNRWEKQTEINWCQPRANTTVQCWEQSRTATNCSCWTGTFQRILRWKEQKCCAVIPQRGEG